VRRGRADATGSDAHTEGVNEVHEVLVTYHFEPESWWADSPTLPGWFAADPDLQELRRLVHESLELHFEEPVVLHELGGELRAGEVAQLHAEPETPLVGAPAHLTKHSMHTCPV